MNNTNSSTANETVVETNFTTNGTVGTSETVGTTSVPGKPHPQYDPNGQTNILVFIFGCCGLGAILRILLRKWAEFVNNYRFGSVMKIPYTVFLIIVGMVLAGIGDAVPAVNAYLITDVDPEAFFHIFLPVVIFESAYVIDIHVFWRSMGNVIFLSVPGLLLASGLTAGLCLILPEIAALSDFHMRIYVALIFGSIISATDPVAVVAMLRELGCQKYLSVIIEGEALLNDGSAIVVFKICLELLQSTTPYFEQLTVTSTIVLILRQSLLGPVIGWIAAKIAGFILQKIYNDALAEITVTLSFTYLVFYIGEALKTSGVLGVVTMGLALDRSAITPQVDHFLHKFWETFAYLANTLLFVMVGVIVTPYIDLFTRSDFFYLFIFYLGIIAIRAVSVFTFFPLMNRFGVEMNWKHMLVMTWGGLRGAVGLTLALFLNGYAKMLTPEPSKMHYDNSSVFENSTVTTQGEPHVDFRPIFLKILMHTAGIVLLTLFINASTTEAVLKNLGMLDVTIAERATMLNAVSKIQASLQRSIAILKCDRFLSDSKWTMVDEMVEVEYPYRHLPGANLTIHDHLFPALHISHSDDLALKDLFEEARLRMIKALKMSFMKQYSHGLIHDKEAKILIGAADKAADYPGEFIKIDDIRQAWVITGMLPYMRHKLEYWMYGQKINQLIPPRNPHRRKIFWLVTNAKFDIVFQLIILANMVPICLDFALEETWKNYVGWLNALEVVNYIFLSIYCIELILRFLGLGWSQFRQSRWLQFDCIIIVIAFAEIITFELLEMDARTGTGSLARTVRTTKVLRTGKILRTLRATRLLRLSRTIFPRCIAFINRLVNKKLHIGYNVGKGYVTAENEVSKLIGSICENEKIQWRLNRASVRNRLIVIREMGLLQRDHPGIATSVKTRNAIRTLLNHIKDAIQQLFSGGVLDETELRLLEQNIDIKQKQLIKFPSFLAPTEPHDIIANIVWIKDDRSLLRYIMNNAERKYYDYEDVIIEEDEELDGIHVIVQGMVKVIGREDGLHQHRNVTRRNSVVSKRLTTTDKDSYSDEETFPSEDYLGTGTIFGDISLLTEGNKRCTVTCETAVQTIFLSVHCMEEAFRLFPFLKKALWKVAAIRMATPLYLEHFEYQGVGLEQIHLHLSQGYIVELTEEEPSFVFSRVVTEVVVIFGTIVVQGTDEIIESPYLLLPEYDEITLHWCPLVILLVIPKEATTVAVAPSLRSLNDKPMADNQTATGTSPRSKNSMKVPLLELHNEEGNVKTIDLN